MGARSESGSGEGGDNIALVFAWEELLRAIRRDLGHDDSGLPRGELLRVFMDGVDQFLPELEATAAAAVTEDTQEVPGDR